MFDSGKAQTALSKAKALYENGNYLPALTHTNDALSHYHSIENLYAPPTHVLRAYLDTLTLHQSLLVLANRPLELLSLQSETKTLIYRLFPNHPDFHYAVWLFDFCETMAIHHFLAKAKYYEQLALSLLAQNYGKCPYYHFMNSYCDAQIAFYMEDYYVCIEAAHNANALWYSKEYGQVSLPFPSDDASLANMSYSIDHMGKNNVLLLCNAYGKINNPHDSILCLLDLLEQQCFDAAQTVSAEITLAELYVINGQRKEALPLYEKYKNSNFANYPQLAAALSSLSYVLETEDSVFAETLAKNKYCYSHDMFTISQYNYGLALASAKDYDTALTYFRGIRGYGYSMTLAILAMQNRSSEIESLRKSVDAYFYRRIHEIVSHYNEELAFNHLAGLQYHIDLTLGAYCHPALPAAKAYDFLLNTKYIAFETSFLQRSTKQNLEDSAPDVFLPKQNLYSAVQIMDKISSDTVFLEYTCVRTINSMSYGVFVVSASQITYVPLAPVSTIDRLVAKWLELVKESALADSKTSPVFSRLQSLNTKLRRELYLPIQSAISNASKLLIAPAGTLVGFPFSRLSCSAKTTLGDHHTITYINTGKELCHSLPVPTYFDTCNSLIIGNPQTTGFPNLSYAEAEADMVSYFLQAKAYKNTHATMKNLLNALTDKPPILHIAAHGICREPSANGEINWENLYQLMTESGIVLADDSLLSCAQVGTLDLSDTHLTVLSCCHSAMGIYQSTEGTYGLRRAFRLAGCNALIANLWQVDDAVSFLWMKAFYEMNTLNGNDYPNSFSFATDTVRQYEINGTHPYANPYYWAGFILVQAP